jgi:lipopolysaccharide export system protein LptC
MDMIDIGADTMLAQESGRAGGHGFGLSPIPPASRPRARALRTLEGLPAHLQNEPAFRAAVQHSRRVRFLRRAIPLGSVLVLTFLVARSVTGLFWSGDAHVESLAIQGRKIVMDKPRLSGFKRDGRSYELTATTATQDIKAPNMVELDALTARMQTGKEGWADLKGAKGVYDSKIERLEVDGGVNVVTQSGLDAKLKDALIEFKAGTIVTDKPVEVTSPQGDVEADRMQVLDNGRRLIFEGRVRSVFVNPQTKAAQAKAAEASSKTEPAKTETADPAQAGTAAQ